MDDQRGLPQTPEGLVLPLNFAPPGARAMGMGGAFIAIADDATAAEANPAGLTILTRPEISLHGLSSSFNVEADDLNAEVAVGLVNSFRRPFNTPLVDADTVGTFDRTISSASFVSFVKPFNKFVFSIYHQQTSNFEGTTTFGNPIFFLDDIFLDAYTTQQSVDVTVDNIGVSGAFKVGKLSIGASIRSTQMELEFDRTLRLDFFSDIEFLVGNFNFTDIFFFRDTIDDDDDDITFNAGLLYNQNGKVSVGLVFKDGGSFTFTEQSEFIDCFDFPGVATCDFDAQTGPNFLRTLSDPVERRVELPDFLGLGFAFRPTQNLTVAVDINHITYSNLNPDALLADIAANPDGFLPEVRNAVEEIDDETEVHLGLEYVFSKGSVPITVRAGIFNEEDRDGFTKVDSDQTNVTAGIGFVFKQDFQIDIAGRVSDSVNQGLLSFVYRF